MGSTRPKTPALPALPSNNLVPIHTQHPLHRVLFPTLRLRVLDIANVHLGQRASGDKADVDREEGVRVAFALELERAVGRVGRDGGDGPCERGGGGGPVRIFA